MTSNSLKERYRNHLKSFDHCQYSSEPELSKHVWNLKNDHIYTPALSNCVSAFLSNRMQVLRNMYFVPLYVA